MWNPGDLVELKSGYTIMNSSIRRVAIGVSRRRPITGEAFMVVARTDIGFGTQGTLWRFCLLGPNNIHTIELVSETANAYFRLINE